MVSRGKYEPCLRLSGQPGYPVMCIIADVRQHTLESNVLVQPNAPADLVLLVDRQLLA